MASQEQVPHASRVGHVAYLCCAGPRWSSFSLHLLIIISHSTICAEGYFGAAAHMRHACQPLPADPCSRFCENLTSLRTGTNRVASLDVQLARQSLTQFQPGRSKIWQRTLEHFPESFCQPHDHRSPVLKRLDCWSTSALMRPSLVSMPCILSTAQTWPSSGCLGNPL